jgi:hypothetical protein
MTSSRSGSGTKGSSSLQPSSSFVIGSIYIHQVPIQSTTNPAKVIKKYGLFQFEEDATNTSWHMYSPLNLTPTTQPLPNSRIIYLDSQGIVLSPQMNTWYHFPMLVTT